MWNSEGHHCVFSLQFDRFHALWSRWSAAVAERESLGGELLDICTAAAMVSPAGTEEETVI